MHPAFVIATLWIVFVLSWAAASFWSRRTEKAAGLATEAPYRIALLIGGLLFFIPAHGYEGALRLWHVEAWQAWLCAVLIAAGFGFCWWARLQLGDLWSPTITKKPNHRVVDRGPYAIVRHPIYTGILLAIFATAAAKGTVLGLAGGALIALGLWMKAAAEERWLAAELGPEAYAAYRARVPMLLPFGPRG